MKPDIKIRYFEMITNGLQSHPSELNAFRKMWNEGDYRLVYVFVMKLKEGHLIELPASFLEIEKEFYSDYVW